MQNLDPALDDLSAVQATDLLLDDLGSAVPGAAGALGDNDLSALLLAWRHETENVAPMPPLVDVDDAINIVTGAARSWWATNTAMKAVALVLLLAVIAALALATIQAGAL